MAITLDERVQGMPGASRTRSLVRKWKKHTSKSPQVRRFDRHSLRNGFTVSSELSSVTRRLLSPSLARDLASLTPALGRQDHTSSPSAAALHVSQCTCDHRILPRVS